MLEYSTVMILLTRKTVHRYTPQTVMLCGVW